MTLFDTVRISEYLLSAPDATLLQDQKNSKFVNDLSLPRRACRGVLSSQTNPCISPPQEADVSNSELNSLNDYEQFVRNVVKPWSREQRIALAAAMAERWLPVYQSFAEEEDSGEMGGCLCRNIFRSGPLVIRVVK